ncbi:MAG: hypothetical protein QW367_04020 [Candidatus Aenigmatarchaeota archaeon]
MKIEFYKEGTPEYEKKMQEIEDAKKNDNNIFYIKDNIKQMHEYDFLEIAAPKLIKNTAPAHNYKKLIKYKKKQFLKDYKNFLNELKINAQEATERYKTEFAYIWCENEIEWAKTKMPKLTIAEQIVLKDYIKHLEENKKEACFKLEQLENTKRGKQDPDKEKKYSDTPENKTKKTILEYFDNIDKKGWQYAFVSEQDYNLFTDLLTNFFDDKPYSLPQKTIQLKRDCKTKVAEVLGELHKELRKVKKLRPDTKYFQLIRVLSPFEKETEQDLYKALTR